MKKLYQILEQERKKGDVGIEIECEGKNIQMAINDFWHTVNDGSLRGEFPHEKAEFVFQKPLFLKDVKLALANLAEINAKAKFNFSFRTSVHVHINVQELTEDQLVSMIYTYALLEDALIFYCGKERKCNRFCLRIQDAEGVLQVISGIIRNGVKVMRNFNEGEIRYAALNLAALTKYGSVEFRAMRGTMDQGIILNWVESLLSIREFAMNVENVTKIAELFTNLGPEKFMELVLKDNAHLFQYKGFDHDMLKCFSLSYDIPWEYEMFWKKRDNEEEVELKKEAFKRVRINPVPRGADFFARPIEAADVARVARQAPVFVDLRGN